MPKARTCNWTAPAVAAISSSSPALMLIALVGSLLDRAAVALYASAEYPAPVNWIAEGSEVRIVWESRRGHVAS